MTRITGIVFDMDGLLLDSERLYLAAFRDTQATLGLPPGDDLFRQTVGTNEATCQGILQTAMGPAADAFHRLWRQKAATLLSAPIPLKPTVATCLHRLCAEGMPIAVATSTHRATARARLDNAGIGDHLPTLVAGDQVTQGKPHPEIFLAAAQQLGLPPEACAAFEDSASGVRAAVAAGMVVTQIPDIVPPTDTLRALGHAVAPDLLTGLTRLGVL
ncbi:MAG: HAD family phosphatase [Pseudomonadota bacterium]